MADGQGPPEPGPVELQGKTYPPLADGEYDAIVMGTGLKECLLAGILASEKKRVLVVDRNQYYGGETASLDLTKLFRKFIKDEDPPKEFFDALGQDRDYNVDLIPKFIMADGDLTKVLVKTGVNNYLELKAVDGSFVFSQKAGKGWFTNGKPGVEKVPATQDEAFRTPLLSMGQKMKLRSFLEFVQGSDLEAGRAGDGTDLSAVPMSGIYAKFGVDDDTQDFIGHSMALKFTEAYKAEPAIQSFRAIHLYVRSMRRFGKSPFIYPNYGLSVLPESFSRFCAVRGGVFMLNRDVQEVVTDEAGKAVGVVAGGEAAKAPIVIGDPSYFPEGKKRQTGRVIRSICVLNARPPIFKDAVESAQVIIPQRQIGRNNDIYITMVSNEHQVVSKGKFLCIVSTTCETGEPAKEVQAAVDLLGPLVTRFDNIVDTYEPTNNPAEDSMFITASYDATSHFETTIADVLGLYQAINGKPYNMGEEDEEEAPGAAGAAGGGGQA